MVDENFFGRPSPPAYARVQIPLWSMKTIISPPLYAAFLPVQIPLWSMKTRRNEVWLLLLGSSDSSMVDENARANTQNFPKPRSDSSMVDENECKTTSAYNAKEVQIPLWSMKTRLNRKSQGSSICSDSSMVDENWNTGSLERSLLWVQIPLWSMKTLRKHYNAIQNVRSDSLWSMKTLAWMIQRLDIYRSDSSMVDENNVRAQNDTA